MNAWSVGNDADASVAGMMMTMVVVVVVCSQDRPLEEETSSTHRRSERDLKRIEIERCVYWDHHCIRIFNGTMFICFSRVLSQSKHIEAYSTSSTAMLNRERTWNSTQDATPDSHVQRRWNEQFRKITFTARENQSDYFKLRISLWVYRWRSLDIDVAHDQISGIVVRLTQHRNLHRIRTLRI